jgi:hypothetical protein
MVQFYFLSILFNALTGYILFTDSSRKDVVGGAGLAYLGNATFRLVTGILTMLSGFLKLLSVSSGDVPVIGDLVPSLLGLFSGFVLVFDYYRSRTTLPQEKTEHFGATLDKNKKWIGGAAIASAALHFLIPSVLLL